MIDPLRPRSNSALGRIAAATAVFGAETAGYTKTLRGKGQIRPWGCHSAAKAMQSALGECHKASGA